MPRGQRTVLIVDDESEMCDVINDCIGQNHRVFLATSGKEALEILESKKVDLLITDISMPGMNGLELIRSLRERNISAEVITLTGAGSSSDRQTAESLNVYEYLVKPIKNEQLKSLITECLIFSEASRASQHLATKRVHSSRFDNLTVPVEKENIAILRELAKEHEVAMGTIIDRALALYLKDSRQHSPTLDEPESRIEMDRLIELSQISSGIAHEINNPLSIVFSKISLYQDRLRSGTVPSANEFVDFLDRINHNLQRVFEIVRGLKSLSRNNETDTPQSASVKEIINEALALKRKDLAELSVRVHLNLENVNVNIQCRKGQILQIFNNLISNSLYAFKNVTIPEITIDVVEEAETIKIFFKDNGPGIPENIQDKVFSPFFTTKPQGVGTGLGLSVCSQIASQHGGRLLLDCSKGKSCFCLELPKH
ncbi:MAG: hypothetical protein COT74_09985 [Bdellovibrionales bacterium CG10_big_fil_rev_8_21_14_0_10_45_34]|nr:MAG: hypothetical protein COT74_09985 [Bdellovibrionales bacterium CG10_big_fil_rev_8_21_14_0_10_45_34]